MSHAIRLPYPPSANRYWRYVNGRVIESAEAKAYKRTVRLLGLANGWKPTSVEVVMCVSFYRPRRIGDTSNRIKVLEDALEGVAFEDDCQIGEVHALRFDDPKDPRAEVTILPREPQEADT